MTVSAFDVASWFVKEGYDYPRNTRDGNMKLQKLLYFSQLVHLAKYNEPLFEQKILAFKDGSVVEEIRQEYHHRNSSFLFQMTSMGNILTPEMVDTIETVVDIFGDASARELSDLNHEHVSWQESYERSKDGGYAWKANGEITIDQLIKNELSDIQEMLEAYNDCSSYNAYIEVFNRKFYYNPADITIDNEIKGMLESFNGHESAYSIGLDRGKLVIF